MRRAVVSLACAVIWMTACGSDADTLESGLGREQGAKLATAAAREDVGRINTLCPRPEVEDDDGQLTPLPTRSLESLDLGVVITPQRLTEGEMKTREARLRSLLDEFEREMRDFTLLEEPCRLAREGLFEDAANLLARLLQQSAN